MPKYKQQQEGTGAVPAGLAGPSAPSAVVLSVHLWQYIKIRIVFLRRYPKILIQEGITQESYGLKHLQEEQVSFELHFPTFQPHALITIITGVCEKSAERSAHDPAPARLWFCSSKHPMETGAEPPYVSRYLQHF